MTLRELLTREGITPKSLLDTDVAAPGKPGVPSISVEWRDDLPGAVIAIEAVYYVAVRT